MLEQLQYSLVGLQSFLPYFFLALANLILFKLAYTALTPHDEWKLVKQGNSAAAIALGGALVGYSIVLAETINSSINLTNFGVWSVVGFAIQLLAFFITRIFVPQLPQRIGEGQTSAGIMSAAFSISIGLLTAACLSF
ncbi:MAG TPA: DUF350 domain-containing protein [Dongiaceae bacterium]|nr:DUF350 domain-containing protein [Dongiaceae bacterium]